jgi:hypothetical protein
MAESPQHLAQFLTGSLVQPHCALPLPNPVRTPNWDCPSPFSEGERSSKSSRGEGGLFRTYTRVKSELEAFLDADSIIVYNKAGPADNRICKHTPQPPPQAMLFTIPFSQTTTIVIVFVIVALCLAAFKLQPGRHASRLPLPPGPPAHWLFGNTMPSS